MKRKARLGLENSPVISRDEDLLGHAYVLRTIRPRSIYEKSILPSRYEEGLADYEGFLFGEKVERVEIKENRLRQEKGGFHGYNLFLQPPGIIRQLPAAI